jgi:hypothetical protein
MDDELSITAVVDLTRFELGNHVEESFRSAWALAVGQPINARHALKAASPVSPISSLSHWSPISRNHHSD